VRATSAMLAARDESRNDWTRDGTARLEVRRASDAGWLAVR
jgi:hypothetical protein